MSLTAQPFGVTRHGSTVGLAEGVPVRYDADAFHSTPQSTTDALRNLMRR